VVGKMNLISAETLTRFTGSSPAAFGSVWVNLLTAGPATDGPATGSVSDDGTEWGEARVAVATTGWTSPVVVPGNPSAVQITNASTITWGDLDLGGVTSASVTHIGVWGSETGTDLLYWDELEVARTVNNGDTFQLGVGKLRIRED